MVITDCDSFSFIRRFLNMHEYVRNFLFAILFLLLPIVTKAQLSLLGPHIGISEVARATVLGIKFEEGISNAGPGTIGGSAKLDYYSWTADLVQTYLLITASMNYHLRLDDSPSFDPFLGVGLGYLYETNKYPASAGVTYYDNNGSGLHFILSIGARYFLSPGFALRLEFGSSQVYAVGGFDFGF